MTLIIGIAGRMRTGKSSLAKLIREMFQTDIDAIVHIDSFAHALRKEVAEALFKNTHSPSAQFLLAQKEEQDKSAIRPLLQAFGQAKRDLVFPDYWIYELEQNIPQGIDVLIIDDVRHNNEADWVLENGGILIRLFAHNEVLIQRGAEEERLKHYSETAMQNPSDVEMRFAHRVLTLNTGGLSPYGMLKALSPFLKEMVGDLI